MGVRRLEADPAQWPSPLAHLLTGDVEAALTDVLGPGAGPIGSWRPTQVTHRPGRSTTVQYRVRSAAPSGRLVTSVVVLAHGDDAPPTLGSGGHRLRGWLVPADPGLPGLARALDPTRVSSLLELLGHPVGPPVLRRRAYRPGRRAVVEVVGPLGEVFLKVVPPERAAALVDVHRRTGLTLPVPRVLGCSSDGVVALSALNGRTLRAALTDLAVDRAGDVDRYPDLPSIEAHLDRLPAGPTRRSGRPRQPLRTLRRHVSLLGTVLPVVAEPLEELVGGVAGRLAPGHPVVPVHGDLYESQLMVTRGSSPRICGLLDLDTVGPGHRVDDLANLCAHLSTLALRWARADDPPAPLGDPTTPVGRYLGSLVTSAEERHDPIDLRARIAARVVGMATGPFRVQEDAWPTATARRIELADAWLASAAP